MSLTQKKMAVMSSYVATVKRIPITFIAPDYISELVKQKIPSRYSLRTNDDRFLLQRTTLRTLSTLGDRSFTVAGPDLWNSLPLQIRSSTNISTFKRKLETYLFRKAYN